MKDKVSTLGAIHICGEGPNGDLVEINFKGRPVRRGDTTGFPMNNPPAIRYRPSYEKWSMKLVIRYDANFIQPRELLYLLNTAGHAVGFGTWRPEKKGQFGMFHVKLEAKARKLMTARKAG